MKQRSQDIVEIAVQINGKVRESSQFLPDSTKIANWGSIKNWGSQIFAYR